MEKMAAKKNLYEELIRCSNNKVLTATIGKIGPLEIPEPRFGNAEDFLARSIVGQQLSVAAARTIWSRVEALAEARGKKVTELPALDLKEEIRACGVSYSKIKALSCLSEYFKEHICEDQLKSLDHLKRSQCLQNIWGIGQWSCDMLSIFHYGDKDIWPLTDAGLKRGLAKILNQEKLDDVSFSEFGESFKPYRSYLSLYLWHTVDNNVL